MFLRNILYQFFYSQIIMTKKGGESIFTLRSTCADGKLITAYVAMRQCSESSCLVEFALSSPNSVAGLLLSF